MNAVVGAVVALVVSLCALPAWAQDSSGAAPAVVREAEQHLLRGDMYYLNGDYYRAITEYQSFLFMRPADERGALVDLKIAWIYYVAEKPAAAETLLRQISISRHNEPIAWWARLFNAQVVLKSDEPLRARRAYESLIADCEPVLQGATTQAPVGREECLALTTRARFGLARYWAGLGDFDDAATNLAAVPRQAPAAADARRVAEYVSTLDIPRKSPAVAGALSVIPGLGHFYLGEWGVGAVALVWNGLFMFATIDSFVGGRVGQGTLLGLLELIWYSGTIFGAVSGAHRHNRDAERIVRDGLLKDIDTMDEPKPWPGEFPVQYPTPLRLRFEF